MCSPNWVCSHLCQRGLGPWGEVNQHSVSLCPIQVFPPPSAFRLASSPQHPNGAMPSCLAPFGSSPGSVQEGSPSRPPVCRAAFQQPSCSLHQGWSKQLQSRIPHMHACEKSSPPSPSLLLLLVLLLQSLWPGAWLVPLQRGLLRCFPGVCAPRFCTAARRDVSHSPPIPTLGEEGCPRPLWHGSQRVSFLPSSTTSWFLQSELRMLHDGVR